MLRIGADKRNSCDEDFDTAARVANRRLPSGCRKSIRCHGFCAYLRKFAVIRAIRDQGLQFLVHGATNDDHAMTG